MKAIEDFVVQIKEKQKNPSERQQRAVCVLLNKIHTAPSEHMLWDILALYGCCSKGCWSEMSNIPCAQIKRNCYGRVF
ncbi:hypothetical protein OPV22_017522 [Ensete ventricosum]|uniref:Uncharacterized protein n=1 Tax=Ensete ventricosum TaxID=4639 RepID=A0AAV8R172_ENSVE|nr:hypothetical protein OPV22_017522 [Ensete ventricosum]